MPHNRALNSFIISLVLLLVSNDISSGTETDLACLENIKNSLQDANNYLMSWDFRNRSEGNICKFSGVMCWHPDENRVLSLTLSDMGLKGQFPVGIVNCTSLVGLDLSNNELSGHLPDNFSKILGFLTTLDLSSNEFTGQIPKSMGNCTYLNVLKLDHNHLSGEIPQELGLLYRLTSFNVANNLLTGPIPRLSNLTNTVTMYANNPGLCNDHFMRLCPSPKRLSNGEIAIVAVSGVVAAVLSVGVCLLFFMRGRWHSRGRVENDPKLW